MGTTNAWPNPEGAGSLLPLLLRRWGSDRVGSMNIMMILNFKIVVAFNLENIEIKIGKFLT